MHEDFVENVHNKVHLYPTLPTVCSFLTVLLLLLVHTKCIQMQKKGKKKKVGLVCLSQWLVRRLQLDNHLSCFCQWIILLDFAGK